MPEFRRQAQPILDVSASLYGYHSRPSASRCCRYGLYAFFTFENSEPFCLGSPILSNGTLYKFGAALSHRPIPTIDMIPTR